MSGRSFEVRLTNTTVGLLSEDDAGRVTFRFSDTYLRLPARPVLSQSFEDNLRKTYAGRRSGELPAFFANLLPEGRFRQILERSTGVPDGDDLGLLAAVAEDLPGAVTLHSTLATSPPGAVEDGDVNGERPGTPGLEFRFSLAGVQLKFSMVRQDEKLALPAHGERGNWIVKVGAEEYPGLAENEFSMLQWAKAAGFDVPDIELRNADDIPQIRTYAPAGSQVLAIRRYDRADDVRIHQEDFMQVFGRAPRGEQKYESTYEELSTVADALLGEAGYEEVIKRLALILGQGNNDAHLKNWSSSIRSLEQHHLRRSMTK